MSCSQSNCGLRSWKRLLVASNRLFRPFVTGSENTQSRINGYLFLWGLLGILIRTLTFSSGRRVTYYGRHLYQKIIDLSIRVMYFVERSWNIPAGGVIPIWGTTATDMILHTDRRDSAGAEYILSQLAHSPSLNQMDCTIVLTVVHYTLFPCADSSKYQSVYSEPGENVSQEY